MSSVKCVRGQRVVPWRDDDWRFMNYGFVPDGPPFPLRPEDMSERASIGLYQQALDGLPVAGARVLEVGSGHEGARAILLRLRSRASITRPRRSSWLAG